MMFRPSMAALALALCAGCNCSSEAQINGGNTRDGGIADGGLADGGSSGTLPDGGMSQNTNDGGQNTPMNDAGSMACVATTASASNVKRPVDIILFVDTSASMGAAVEAVRQSINTDFASILSQSNIDYRVICLADRAQFCVDPPLGGSPCTTGATSTPTSQFLQFSVALGSGNGLSGPLARYTSADDYNQTPGGWSSWLRADAYKVFLQLTDSTSESDISASQFDQQLLALTPSHFGTSASTRKYTYHVIMGVPSNVPATKPWLPSDPIQTNGCDQNDLYGWPQETYQLAAMNSGGLRFSLCDPMNYSVVFREVAAGVIQKAAVPCELTKPVPSNGQTLDESTVLVKYTSGSSIQRLLQVANAGACTANSFYMSATSMVLCPQACAVVQADPNAQLSVEYGCKIDIR